MVHNTLDCSFVLPQQSEQQQLYQSCQPTLQQRTTLLGSSWRLLVYQSFLSYFVNVRQERLRNKPITQNLFNIILFFSFPSGTTKIRKISVSVPGPSSSISTRTERERTTKPPSSMSQTKESVTQHRISTAYVPVCRNRRRHVHDSRRDPDCPCICS